MKHLGFRYDFHRVQDDIFQGFICKIRFDSADTFDDIVIFDDLAENRMMVLEHGVGTTVTKNWELPVLGPALAIARIPGSLKSSPDQIHQGSSASSRRNPYPSGRRLGS